MLAPLVLALLASAPAGPPAAGASPPHAPAEAALLRAAYPDHDPGTGWLGHSEGFLVDRSSACAESGNCFLAVAAASERPGGATAPGHAWTTFFAFRAADGGWLETGSAAGPVIPATTRWAVGVSVAIDGDGPWITVTTSAKGGAEGDASATHLWSWDGRRFLPVLTAATARQGGAESEASFVLCADRLADKPSWELRSREREGRGSWTEGKVRIAWNGQGWVERPADRACLERSERSAVVASAAAATLRVRAATASTTAAAPRGQPKATAPANAIDGSRQTAWVAGGKKGGVGEWLQVDLAAPAVIGSLQLLGTCPGADWKASPRLKRVRLRFEDGPPQDETLADVQAAQSIVLKRKAPARWVRIELVELYRGTKKNEACVTEVTPQAR